MKTCPYCKSSLTEGQIIHDACLQEVLHENKELGKELLAAVELIHKKNARIESLIGRTSNVLTPGDAAREIEALPLCVADYRLYKSERGASSLVAECHGLDALARAAFRFGELHPLEKPVEIFAVEVRKDE